MIRLVYAAIFSIVFGASAYAQTPITLGETNPLGFTDSGNAGLLLADGPFQLTQSATIQSLAFYVNTKAGQLRLGIYDSGPNHDCVGGSLKAQTAAFSPTHNNQWVTANVVTQVTLPVGSYCLAYSPSSNSLSFRKGMSSGIVDRWQSFTFGSMPTTFSSSPSGPDGFHWSLYANLVTVPVNPTLQISINPPAPSVPSTSPGGTVVGAVTVTWSNGNPFTGTLGFGSPYFTDGGIFALDGSNNLIVSSTGPGLSGDNNTVQNVTLVATQ